MTPLFEIAPKNAASCSDGICVWKPESCGRHGVCAVHAAAACAEGTTSKAGTTTDTATMTPPSLLSDVSILFSFRLNVKGVRASCLTRRACRPPRQSQLLPHPRQHDHALRERLAVQLGVDVLVVGGICLRHDDLDPVRVRVGVFPDPGHLPRHLHLWQVGLDRESV